MKYVVAVLETMWNWYGMTSGAEYAEAPRYFCINPENHSGRRLYRLVGPGARLIVTNACRNLAVGPTVHGKPDPIWLGENLRFLDGVGDAGKVLRGGLPPDDGRRIDVLLVCGKVAQRTFDACGYEPREAAIVRIPHPAARMWTKQMISDISALILGVECGARWAVSQGGVDSTMIFLGNDGTPYRYDGKEVKRCYG